MAKNTRKYQEAVKLLDKTKTYPPQEAIELAKKMTHTKFDETVELHLQMGLDPQNTAQQVRGVALLPHGLGKKVRVLIFAQGEAERIAQAAGADFVGNDELKVRFGAKTVAHRLSKIMTDLRVDEGDVIRVNTETGEYAERV